MYLGGLDASTALDYANSLRIMTDVSNRTTFVTLYQAGEGIYKLFDKVLVIDSGKMMYQGPAAEAKEYFQNLGYHCPERQTTADFLTSIGDPNERQFSSGVEVASVPKTADELEAAFRKSDIYQQQMRDIENYEHQLQRSNTGAERFQGAVGAYKSKHVSGHSSYTVPFHKQVWACTLREFWLLWGDKTTLYTKIFIIISNGLIVGSLFYGESLDTSGAFSRGGAIFFSVLFIGWLQLTELMKAVSGRVVVARHREYAFYRPSAVVMARIVLDIPVVAVQTLLFGTIMYFMCNLDINVSKYWIYQLFVYLASLTVTALYRMFAALSPTIDDAVRFSGICTFSPTFLFQAFLQVQQLTFHSSQCSHHFRRLRDSQAEIGHGRHLVWLALLPKSPLVCVRGRHGQRVLRPHHGVRSFTAGPSRCRVHKLGLPDLRSYRINARQHRHTW